MLDDLYTKRLLELAQNIARVGTLAHPTHIATAHNKLCGSTIFVQLCMHAGKVSDYAQDVQACALGKAAASLLGGQIIGKTPAQIFALHDAMVAMLKSQEYALQGGQNLQVWQDLQVWDGFNLFEVVRSYPERMNSVLLPFQAVCAALEEYDPQTT
jgi:NifU-like protein involved in Fe-S cluster formation